MNIYSMRKATGTGCLQFMAQLLLQGENRERPLFRNHGAGGFFGPKVVMDGGGNHEHNTPHQEQERV